MSRKPNCINKDPSFADSLAKYYPEWVFIEFNPKDFEKYWKKMEDNVDVKSIIAQLAEQAYRKCVISIAMKMQVDESDVKVRRSQEDFNDLVVLVKNNKVGHITVTFVFNPETLSNNVVVTFHQHPC